MLNSESLNDILKRAKNTNWNKNSYNCNKCPKEGCPNWWNFTWTMEDINTKTIKEKLIEGCGDVILPLIITDLAASNYMSIDRSNYFRSKLDKAVINLETIHGQIKTAFLSILRLMGADHIKSLIEENNELKTKLKEKNVKVIEQNNKRK